MGMFYFPSLVYPVSQLSPMGRLGFHGKYTWAIFAIQQLNFNGDVRTKYGID
jgi:hypothetical protein